MINHIVCNWCETETTEQQLEIRTETEHCPQCGNNGYLMDMQVTQ